ncbi:MAG TPA: type 1 glutamine amidotransferase [Coriobacteriia bacterium]
MRIACVMHVPFEGPGAIAEWAAARGHQLVRVDAPRGAFPTLSEFDLLVVLGGPMSTGDVLRHPWLVTEKQFMSRCVEEGVLTVGLCLGSQLLAEAIGGHVHPGTEPEIGWYPVTLGPAAVHVPYFSGWPTTFVAGHWHGDTFDLPDGVESAASSELTANQAFAARDGRVVGLQFHLEWTRDALRALTIADPEDLATPGRWVMGAEALLSDPERFDVNRALLFGMLDRMEELA